MPVIGFLSGIVTGLAGLGGALVSTALWQLTWSIFHIRETDSLDLLVLVVTMQQVNTVSVFAYLYWRSWKKLAKVGIPYAIIVTLFSPLGAFCRDHLDTHRVQTILAWVLIAFASGKLRLPECDKGAAARKYQSVIPPDTVGKCEKAVEGRVDAEEGRDGTAAIQNSGNEACSPESPSGPVQSPATEKLDLLDENDAEQDAVEFSIEGGFLKWIFLISGALTGILGGFAGLPGPPFILFVTMASIPKDIARLLFPLGMSLETPVRLGMFVQSRGLAFVATDLHILLFTWLANSFGLRLGNYLSAFVSQVAFETALLALLSLSSLVVLGLFTASTPSIVALSLTAVFLVFRFGAARFSRHLQAQGQPVASR